MSAHITKNLFYLIKVECFSIFKIGSIYCDDDFLIRLCYRLCAFADVIQSCIHWIRPDFCPSMQNLPGSWWIAV